MTEITKVTDERLAELVLEWRKAMHQADKGRRAAGVFKAKRELDKLWAEQDRRKGR